MELKFLSNPIKENEPLLSQYQNLVLMLNVDWFHLFVNSNYKVGVMYMSVLNLSRHKRYKRKWTLLVSLIPGPKEPEGHINTFLSPLVDSLIYLFENGLWIDLKANDKLLLRSVRCC